jgi:hypothetical protein
MMNVCLKKILVSRCTQGVYLRWWFNGWHYFNFTNGYEIAMQTASQDVQVSQFFSVISKVERDTRITSDYAYDITLHGIRAEDIAGFTGLLLAERVEQYELGAWREVDVVRGDHVIKEAGTNGYILDFTITRKELPGASSVYQKALRLYIGDTLCDMDDAEIVPINKQVNDIAQMQDRNSDFTASFKIRKTRAMRALFELSGEVGAAPDFPYQRQECRLVQDNIEIITGGILVLDRVTDQYYNVSIVSGNVNFFNVIAAKKISDLTLASMEHTWNFITMIATHTATSPYQDIVYPLCEPSDDGSMCPIHDTGDSVQLKADWIWCFCKVKTIWEEIFAASGFTVTGGDVLNGEIFDRLFMPISSLKITNTDKFLYSVWWGGTHPMTGNEVLAFTGASLILGDAAFASGYYTCPYTATYTFSVAVIAGVTLFDPAPTLYLTEGILHNLVATFIGESTLVIDNYTVEYAATAGEVLSIVTTPAYYLYYSIAITKIEGAKLAYGSVVNPVDHLPNMTQIDFVKMICNLFGLVPEVKPRDRTIRFWNYAELYENMPLARDWSKYLSERDDETEFKFGDYAQSNYLKYKQSEDVTLDNGLGNMPIDDETLPEEKDIVQLGVSTTDEVRVMLTNFPVDISRIAFNKWNDTDADYDPQDTIDARIVYIDRVRSVASPPYEKTLVLEYLHPVFGWLTYDIPSPLKASSLDISFSRLITYYSHVSRLLTKTTLRRAKFNLPVYEVAGLRHNVPVYLSQYKAYFYVNKISNYVPGRLCTIDLIRL